MFFDKLLEKLGINKCTAEERSCAQSLIDEAQSLAAIINTTTDSAEFYSSLDKIISILSELQTYEDKISFINTPTHDLEYILSTKKYIIDNFNERVVQKELELKSSNNQQVTKELTPESSTEQSPKIVISEPVPPTESNITSNNVPYESDRIFINGLHPLFISVLREIITSGKIVPVTLMREYHLSKDDLEQILEEGITAHLLDADNNILVTKDFYENFLDHYEPTIYKCKHGDFDKELLVCIGEIAIENGADTLYDEFDADDILDYLQILENLGVLSYNSVSNQFDVLISVDEFHNKCLYIPETSKNILKNINLETLDKMDGHDFEYACAEILKKNGFENVTVTSGSGDHGVDIFASKSDISFAIQCKRYNDTVPNDAVQAAFSSKNMFKKDIAVVMTNSHLSAHGMEEAQSLNVKIWDRERLKEMISNASTT